MHKAVLQLVLQGRGAFQAIGPYSVWEFTEAELLMWCQAIKDGGANQDG